MSDAPNEFILGFLTLTLSAKGTVALLLAAPVSSVLIALAWRIARQSSYSNADRSEAAHRAQSGQQKSLAERRRGIIT